MDAIQHLPPSDAQYEAEIALRSQIYEEARWEELLWKNKSRITWLTTKDLNTKHFHLSTIIRRRSNRIDAIKTSTGHWKYHRKHIGDLFLQHFKDIYKTSNPDLAIGIEELIQPTITPTDNLMLCNLPTKKEIHIAVKSIGAHKAPSPDGMTAHFFHHYWPTVRAEVICMVQNFFFTLVLWLNN